MLRCTGPVLIVEDDLNTANLVKTYLENEGFTSEIATDGETAVHLARHRRPCIIILDIMLPRLDGWEVCRQVRTFSTVPVLMLTAREEEIDRVTGLSLGADDYVIKPFSPRELVARVKAILRRSSMQTNSQGRKLVSGGLELDLDRHRVSLDGRTIDLTSSEYKLLQALMKAPGRVFSRNELLDSVYHDGEIVIDRVIDVHIGKLRQKIERQPSHPRYIRTVRGFGYAFAAPGDL